MAIVFPLLSADQIEVKIKQVTAKGAVLLLYKTARTDMDMLDQVIGPEAWTCDYKEIKGNLYCGIGIKIDGEWVWKWNCGIESRADGEGNEKKGEASDAFKRSGFNWGIGRELYTAPFIFVQMETEQDGRSYRLKDRFVRFSVTDIAYDDKRCVSKLIICDSKGKQVYTFGTGSRPASGTHEAAQEAGQKKLQQIKAQQIATREQKTDLWRAMTEEQRTATTKQYGEGWGLMTVDQAQRLMEKLRASA